MLMIEIAGGTRPIITRKEAKAAGLAKFFTGRPCNRMHLAERNTVGGDCTMCLRLTGQRYEEKWKGTEKWREMRRAIEQRQKERRGEEIRAQARANYHVNQDKVRARKKAWREANPEICRLISLRNEHKRRAKRMGSQGTHTLADINALLKKQKSKCAHPWCQKSIKTEFHTDHIMPLSLGGSDDRSNLQLLCVFCNLSKGSKHPVDYANRHGMLV